MDTRAVSIKAMGLQSAHRRRRWRRAMLAVLLAVGSSLVVAWLLAALRPITHSWSGEVALDGDHLQPWFIHAHAGGASRVVWFEKGRVYGKPGIGPAGASSAAVSSWSFATGTRHQPSFVKATTGVVLPPSVSALKDGPDIDSNNWGVAIDRRGWPFGCLSCVLRAPMDPTSVRVIAVDGGVPIEVLVPRLQDPSPSMFSFVAIPFTPVWGGLVGDVVVHALIWLAILRAPGMLLGAMRRRKGRCPACGYDLRGMTGDRCPECGGATLRREPLPVLPGTRS